MSRHCKRILLACLFLGFAVACEARPQNNDTPLDSDTISVTMPSRSAWAPTRIELVRGLVTFQAAINGKPATVLLDNGASWTAIDDAFAKRVGSTLKKSAQVFQTGRAVIPTWQTDGITFDVPKAVMLKGRFKTFNLEVVSKAMGRPIDAVLGGDVLHKFAMMIDVHTSKMLIVPSGSISPKGNDVAIAPMSRDGQINASINGKNVRLAVDLGSSGVVSLSDMAWNKVFTPSQPFETPGRSITADGASVNVRLTKASLSIDSIHVPYAPISNGFAPVDAVDGIVGTGLLLKGVVVLDAPAQKLLFFRPPTFGTSSPSANQEH